MPSLGDIRSLDVILTAACNLACTYCYQNAKQPRRMEWRTLRAALDLLLQSSRAEVKLQFFGGEPLLQFPLIRQAVAYAEEACPRNKRIRYAIITNGTLLDDEAARFLSAHRFRTQLSFDGVPPAQDLRGRGTFRVLDSLLARLKTDHPAFFRRELCVSITLTSRTISCLADSVQYFLGKGLQDIAISYLFTHDPAWRAEMIEDLDRQFARIHRISLSHYRRTGEVPVGLFRKDLDASPHYPKGRTMCGAGEGETLTVDVDGEVHGCVTFADSMQKFPSEFLRSRLDRMRMGDLRDEGFPKRLAMFPQAAREAQIFNNKQEKYSSYGRCGDCRFLNECAVCPVSIGHVPGNTDPHRVPDFPCAFNLVSLKYRKRFPRQADRFDILTGRAPIPRLMRDLEAFTHAQRNRAGRAPAGRSLP